MFGLPVLQLDGNLLPRGEVYGEVNLPEGATTQLPAQTKSSCYPDIHVTLESTIVQC